MHHVHNSYVRRQVIAATNPHQESHNTVYVHTTTETGSLKPVNNVTDVYVKDEWYKVIVEVSSSNRTRLVVILFVI